MDIKHDNIVVPDEDVNSGVIVPEHKTFVNPFGNLYCYDCETHLNGSTICPNCGKDQNQ